MFLERKLPYCHFSNNYENFSITFTLREWNILRYIFEILKIFYINNCLSKHIHISIKRKKQYIVLNPDPDQLIKSMDPDPDPSSISKNSKKNLDFYCFVISFWLFAENFFF